MQSPSAWPLASKTLTFGVSLGFSSLLHHLLAEYCWLICFASLSLSFLTGKTNIIISTSEVCSGDLMRKHRQNASPSDWYLVCTRKALALLVSTLLVLCLHSA